MRRRRSGTLNMLRTAVKNFSITTSRLGAAEPSTDYADGQNRVHLLRNLWMALLRTDLHYCAASLLDLFASTLREAMCRNTQRLGDLAVSEHYNIMFRLLDQAARVQHLGRDLFTRIEVLFERRETDLQPAFLEDVGEAALRQTPMQRHLAAFESDLARITRARLLSLLTAARGLAETRARSTAHSFLLVRRSLCRL